MSEFLFLKTQQGLSPASDEAREWLARKKLGSTILVEPRELRNPGYFKKYFALLELAYSYWSEAVEPMEYKGQPVEPDFQHFRHDVVILAGFHKAITNLKGEIRLDAESLKWSKMTEERFTKLYSASINVLLRMVFNGKICPKWTEEQLRNVASQIVDFG